MAEEHGPTQHHQPEKAGNPSGISGMMTGKKKWYLIGGLAAVAILVFVFVRKSNSNASGSQNTANPTGTGSLDPATQAALQSALQGQAAGTFSGGGAVQGPAGPAGPTGPAGSPGAAGKPGAPGAPGKPGVPGKPPVKKPTPPSKKPVPIKEPAPHSHQPKPPVRPTKTFYTVKPGDSLSAIASHFKLPNWQTLYNANRTVVGGNPDIIHPGQRLVIP